MLVRAVICVLQTVMAPVTAVLARRPAMVWVRVLLAALVRVLLAVLVQVLLAVLVRVPRPVSVPVPRPVSVRVLPVSARVPVEMVWQQVWGPVCLVSSQVLVHPCR